MASGNATQLIHWYPGHVAKWDRLLEETLKRADVVLEVRDARLPLISRHPELAERLGQKPVLTLLNKASLADADVLKAWVHYLLNAPQPHERRPSVLPWDALHAGTAQRNALLKALNRLGQQALAAWCAKGLKPRPLRVMVVGFPNVGKSTVINALLQRKKVATGHRAGVTRAAQWVRLPQSMELLDSPGILPAYALAQEQALCLAAVHSVGSAAFDEEQVARFVLERLSTRYQAHLAQLWQLPTAPQEPLTLEAFAQVRGWLLPQGRLDVVRAAQALMKDLRLGRLGPVTLEEPPALHEAPCL
jgi:ribosome biogenesis GTPase A